MRCTKITYVSSSDELSIALVVGILSAELDMLGDKEERDRRLEAG